MTSVIKDRLILALDVDNEKDALNLVEDLWDVVGYFKIGMQLYYSCGSSLINKIHALGGKVFLDLKLHDIPNTVYSAAKVLSGLNVAMTNFHASGGRTMLENAVKGLHEGSPDRLPLALGVTVLTSIDQETLSELGIPSSVKDTVAGWARLCKESGLNGVVCSPQEIEIVKEACGKDFITVTPGIRPSWAAKNDQKRITTPSQAIEKGGDYIVVGRPIRAAANSREAAIRILEEMKEGLVRKENR